MLEIVNKTSPHTLCIHVVVSTSDEPAPGIRGKAVTIH